MNFGGRLSAWGCTVRREYVVVDDVLYTLGCDCTSSRRLKFAALMYPRVISASSTAWPYHYRHGIDIQY